MSKLTFDKCKILIPFGPDPLRLSQRKYSDVRNFADEIARRDCRLHESGMPFGVRIDDRKQAFDFRASDKGLAPNYVLQCFRVTNYVYVCDLFIAQKIKPKFQTFELWAELNPRANHMVQQEMAELEISSIERF